MGHIQLGYMLVGAMLSLPHASDHPDQPFHPPLEE